MRSLAVLFVVFTISFGAPTGIPTSVLKSGHIKKRSFNHGVAVVEPATFYTAPTSFYSAPASFIAAPSAVSHQSREDVRTSQTVVSGSPVVARTIQRVASPAVVSPVQTVYQIPSVYTVPAEVVYNGATAVSHQSRVDSKTSSVVVDPAVVSHPQLVQSTGVENLPSVVDARSVYAAAPESWYQPTVYSTLW